jgi:hypothetical protein
LAVVRQKAAGKQQELGTPKATRPLLWNREGFCGTETDHLPQAIHPGFLRNHSHDKII